MARKKGNANVIVEILLDAQSTRVSNTEFKRDEGSKVVNVTDRIKRLVWEDNVLKGGFSFTIILSDLDWVFWKKLIAGQEGTRLQLRLTFESENTVERTPWRTCYIDVPETRIESQAITLVLEGGDKRFQLMQLGRFVAHKEKRITDIVRDIAQRYSLTANVADMDDTPEDRLQPGISDWDFLQHKIMRDVATRNRGDVYLWVEEDLLNLRPIDYTQKPVRSYSIGLSDDRVMQAFLTMNNRKADRDGAARVSSTGFDFENKKGITFEVNSNEAAKAPALSSRLPRKQADGLVNIANTSEFAGSLERGAFRKWGLASTTYAQLELVLKPDFTLAVGSMISLTVESTLNQSLFVDGSYPVLKVQHEVSKNGFRTRVLISRRESQIGLEDAPGTQVGQQPKDGYFSDSGEQGRKVVTVTDV